jgi:hypothetical protein
VNCDADVKRIKTVDKKKGVWNIYSFHKQIGLKFEKTLVKCYICSVALYGAETWSR